MRLINFSYHIFCKNMFMSIVIIVQLLASVLIINDVIVTANNYYVTVDEYKNSGLSEINGIIIDDDETPVPQKLINRLPKNSVKYCELGCYANFGEYEFIGYSNEFVQDYKPEIAEGKWLSDCTADTNMIPAVLPYYIEGVQVGDIINVDSEEKIRLEIVGILKNPYYCTFKNGGSGLNTKIMLENIDEDIVVLTLNNCLPQNYLNNGITEAIVFKDSVNIDKAYDLLSRWYYCRTFNDVLKNGKKDAFSRVRALSPFIVMLTFVSVIGMIGCLSVSTYKNLNFYSILYFNGASINKCFLISALHTVIFIVITLIFYFVIFYFVMKKTMCLYNWFTIIAIIVMLLSLSLIPCRILKNNPPVEILRCSN